ncbi:MAG: hypothetical protein WA842_00295 [Croceibacterium sp.]
MIEVDLAGLGIDLGGDLLLRRALRRVAVGEGVAVRGTHPELALHLRAWARQSGLGWQDGAVIRTDRFEVMPLEQAGGASLAGVADHPPQHWGLAGRGAQVERGGPDFDFSLIAKAELWADDAARLYARACAMQWDPESAIDWTAPVEHDEDIEDAVVQVMTYLIENETAALLVPARFLARLHPHFREVMQLLAMQAAEEARHIEVFTRRALLHRPALGISTTGGQASLKTLVDEPDFALASFTLSVMGEGSFLVLLDFLARLGPDPVTRAVCRLAAQDEARHVAFGLAHLRRHAAEDSALLPRLAAAMHRRHDELAQTAGLNARVFEALTVIAAGGFSPAQIGRGHAAVMHLQADMDSARRASLTKLGFAADEAEALSGLHTRNFM